MMTRNEILIFYLEAKALIERKPIDTLILPEIYQVVEAVSYAPMGFDKDYINKLIASIPEAYKEEYEAYGLHFTRGADVA